MTDTRATDHNAGYDRIWAKADAIKAATVKISKECATLKAAERYQNSLYERFDYVHLIQSPRFTEKGNYIWDCREKTAQG